MCLACASVTRVGCKASYHLSDPSVPCANQDVGNAMVRQVARENGYQECPSCHRLVEIPHGCNHMNVRTRFEHQDAFMLTKINKMFLQHRILL
jgi:hypothetical protein